MTMLRVVPCTAQVETGSLSVEAAGTMRLIHTARGAAVKPADGSSGWLVRDTMRPDERYFAGAATRCTSGARRLRRIVGCAVESRSAIN